jgi:Replication-relaxation
LILSLVNRYRLIASNHLCRLIDGSQQHLIRRLGRLYHSGYLERPRCQLLLSDARSRSFVHCITAKGRKELRHRGVATFSTVLKLSSPASALSLAHSTSVSDILSQFEADARSQGLRFLQHHDWSEKKNPAGILSQFRWFVRFRHGGRWIGTWVIPDAAFSLESDGMARTYFFIEVDRGTMPVIRSSISQTSFRRKILAYKETRTAGVLWKHSGIPAFRVLVITESRTRMRNLQAATASCFQRGESGMFLFASLDDSNQALFLNRDWEKCSGAKVPLLK